MGLSKWVQTHLLGLFFYQKISIIFSNHAKYDMFTWYTPRERRGKAMRDKLSVSERRTKILEYLALKRKSTRIELSLKFNVSICTIARDIIYLSSVAPIYTKQGNQGGVYILPEYRSYKNYLTDAEEACLYNLMKKASNEECRILCGIITKFTKKANEND